MTATPSLVLRGGESVLRFAGGPVTLHRPDKEHHIPLAAISFVHAEGRSVAIVLTASGANEPTIYRVAGVSEAGALAFADAVTAALPEVPAPDGAELVTTSTPGAAGPRRARWKPVAVAVVAVLVALDAFIALNGPRGEYAVVFWMAAAFAATGVLLVRSAGREAYRQWRLPRHGITVVGEFSHYTNDRKVYRYTDATGAGHTYTATSGPDAIELAYDPRAPERAIQPDTPYGRVMGGLVTLLGCAMAAGSVAAAGALVLAAARG
ncbi:subtilisin family serine protease [Streptomyces filamentosus]|uniref:DUF3592 domain-containing protein n=1 Tax=Streptomyces filamentosus TaxID=67294 RepID=UPI0038094D55